MLYHMDLNKITGDLYCRTRGHWDVPTATRFVGDMKELRRWTLRSGKSLTILVDLRDLAVHSQDVAPIVGEGSRIIDELPVTRYAMIIPGALMRMQARRIDPDTPRQFFTDVPSAANWLGWRNFVPVE